MNLKVNSLLDMVKYQDGSIVSKTLIKKPTGTITLFAFDKDQGLSEHTAPFEALVHILEGELELTISKTMYLLTEGQIIILPKGAPHSLNAKTKFKMSLTMIKS